jgi:hypothetical protein
MTAMKRIFAFLFLVAVASCIDPYIPDLKNYKSLLVVEGLITNENNSYKIKLSRTTGQENSIPEKVTDANVYITDGDGIKTDLQNLGDGNYKTDSTSFTGIIGQKYTLQIITIDGKEYKSEECTMLPVAGIDKIYYEKGDEISGNLGESFTGLKILLNSTDATGTNQYFRWTYEETWEFLLPNPPRYKCVFVNDQDTYLFEFLTDIKENCWKKNKSGEIIINSILSGSTNFINKQLIQFIDPVKSDRLTKEYSILVKQYSISEKEYNFWNNLKKAGNAGGDIFNSQPYQVISNVHNVNDANEMVLGYFEVSTVSQKRIFITADQLNPLYLPHYQTDCVEIAKSPEDWPLNSLITFYEIYHNIMNPHDFTFIRPIFNPDNTLKKLVYATKVCSLCEYSGSALKPDFWIDLK